jgi:hypothetical protein
VQRSHFVTHEQCLSSDKICDRILDENQWHDEQERR